MAVTVPPGVGPGMPIQIQVGGAIMQVVVPQGVGPGQQFMVQPMAQPMGGVPVAQPMGGPPMAQPMGGPPMAQPMGGAPVAQPMGPPVAQPVLGQPVGQQPAHGGAFNVGDHVEVDGDHCVVVRILGAGRYAVDYRDGETSYEEVSEGDMRRVGGAGGGEGCRFNVGDCVVVDGDRAWVVKVLGGGRFAVDYRDGATSYEELDEGDMRRA